MNEQRGVQFRGLAPYLFYEDAEAALEWLSRVLGFTERVRYVDADGVVREAEMTAGEAEIHIAGMGPGHWDRSGVSGPIGQLVIVYVDDVDAHHARAIAAGAEAPAPEDKPYAARVYTVQDPGGNTWTIWQHLRAEVELAEGWQEIRAPTRGADGQSGRAGRSHDERKAMAGELAFFEIGVEDTERGRAFYERLFGWKFEPGPFGKGFAITAPNVPGGMHGGDAGASPYVFFKVEDIEAAVEQVLELGGTVEEVNVEGDDESIARFGRFKLCRDDQGSPFGLHQPPSG